MTTDTLDYLPGNLVRARGREWVVQADTHQGDGGSLLRLRPLGGADEDIITLIPELEFEPVTPATRPQPVATSISQQQAGGLVAALLRVRHSHDSGSAWLALMYRVQRVHAVVLLEQ